MAAALEAFAAKLANVLVGMAKEEAELLLGVPGAITRLETTLGDLSSILADAERRRVHDSAVDRWVAELRDAMYDADDVLDLFRVTEDGGDATGEAAPACWKMMLLCLRGPGATHKIGRRIQAINERVEEIARRSSRFGFVAISQVINSSSLPLADKPACSTSWHENSRKTGPSIVRSDVVGEKIDLHARKLVNLLVDKAGQAHAGSDNVVAFAITGAGGIGKTTLARMVFNDGVAENHFDKKIWLSVNQEVNEINLLHSVIAAFGGNYHCCACDRALLEDTLKQAVRQERFLLVMDDVWSDKVWSNLLRAPLSVGAPGSRLLVTTRNDGVARAMKAQHLHRVILNEGDEYEINGLEDIGLKIVERCDGLPLAIKVVGGLFLNKGKTRDAWVNISNHFAWSITRSNDDINKAVYLSYEELPPHLKQCFLFSSLIPKDELIKRGVIVRMWIAEGYGQHDKMGSTLPEDLGCEYYNELVSRNLLEPDKGSYGLSACTMHDVVRSFAQQMMKDEGRLVSDRQNVNSSLGASKLRHLSVSKNATERVALHKQVSLRTLMLFGRSITELMDFSSNISCLRVLHLHGVDIIDLPDYICHLKHLRYLGLANTSISAIPRCIGGLKFLQFIDLMGCQNLFQLPDSILKLQNIRFLDFRGTRLTSIPEGMRNLEDLVHLLGFPTYLDDNRHAWSSLEELRSLSNLKWLDLRGLELASSGSIAARAMLSSKKHLKILDLAFASRLTNNRMIEGISNTNEEQERAKDVLSNLCPPPCIECLTINGYFGYQLAQWMKMMSAFPNLRRLELKDYSCCKQLPVGLGQLHFLDFLWVEHAPSIVSIGHDLLFPSFSADGEYTARTRIDRKLQRHCLSHGAGFAFPKLETLGLKGMLGWRTWNWDQHAPAMPSLDALTITDCKLCYLPLGLAHQATALRVLDLRNAVHLVSLENFPSLVELRSVDNTKLERITNSPRLRYIVIIRCPGLKVMKDLQSLRSVIWKDLDADALPEYLRENMLNKLEIQHIQLLKAYGKSSVEDKVDRHIFYTKDPLARILAETAKEEVEALLGVPGEITRLEATLGDLRAVLSDAERRRARDRGDAAVDRWVRDLRDAMYDADDILDECQSPPTAACCFFFPGDPVRARGIGKRIRALNRRLEAIERRSSRFGFVSDRIIPFSSPSHRGGGCQRADAAGDYGRRTAPGLIRSDVVGEKIAEDTRILADILVSKMDLDDDDGGGGNVVIPAIAITGAGGIGKTTLARMVFGDATVQENFDIRIWLFVGQDADEVAMLRSAIAHAGGPSYNDEGLAAAVAGDKAVLERALERAVRHRKVLLVMDDAWGDAAWNELLRVPLSHAAAPGSRMLVTTRNEGVAHRMKARFLHRVDKLRRQDAWSLLKKQIILNKSDEAELDELEDIGMQIIDSCDGLPLAIKMIGGLLLSKSRTRGSWMEITRHSAWSKHEVNDEVNKVVRLSYEELPSHLKQCFVYCSLFPRGEVIESRTIVRMWIAEGFAQDCTGSRLPETIAAQYYKELILRNLLDPSDGYYDQLGCIMHDVVRSFAQYVAKDEGLSMNEMQKQTISDALGALKIRRLCISNKKVEWDALQTQASLRTLILFRSIITKQKNFLNNLPCLRVLHLEDTNLIALPDSICYLKHLRYLGLKGTYTSALPKLIGNLMFLQHIDLCGCINVSELPESIVRLRNLRSLDIRYTMVSSVPRGFRKLENLAEMLGFPTNLDDDKRDWCNLEELGYLPNLSALHLEGLEKATFGSMAARAKLSSKQHLTQLELRCTSRISANGEVQDEVSKEDCERIENVFDHLCPPPSIDRLTIAGYFGHRLPQWMETVAAFRSLRRLVLEDYACCDRLPIGLGQLPYLDYLWIEHAPSIEHVSLDFITAVTKTEGAGVAFPKLKRLGFQGMLRWAVWDWEEHFQAMPALESLTVENCKLRLLPQGLAYHASALKTLVLTNAMSLASVDNFHSLAELYLADNPKLERVVNCPSLTKIEILRCPQLKVFDRLPAVRSIVWEDLDADTLPVYLQEAKVNRLHINCNLGLLNMISLQDAISEWRNVQHVQQLKVFGFKPQSETSDFHFLYTKEPHRVETNIDWA
uniref:AAA+ ATPase domain-containing protein n=1 Tax=Leersia perrieri TaxID=77586 RepID=A0A0D9VXM8_9ORYZ